MNSKLKQAMTLGGLALASGLIARHAFRQARWFDYRGKVAVVTGGSRGLGLVLARELVDRGARVAITARTQTDLDAALLELRDRGGDVTAIACDVRDPVAVEAMIADVLNTFGTIDVLFNVAGIIEVGPLDAMTLDDFQNSMATNCWGALHTALTVLPEMRRRRTGRIVNVASLGGKRAVPHLLPYAASKFALVGLSNGLRTELAKEGILVTTICPSLMNTGSPRNAIFKGQNRKEYAWFSIGDSLPGMSMDARRAALQILRACQYGDREVIVHEPWNIAIRLQSLTPGLTQELLCWMDRVLPEMGGIGQRAARGYESQSTLSESWLTARSQQAAVENNEMRPHP
ncbi:SDR family NAD(P)-dependent oxidoreductase [Planctomicrobium piriforme]|uniref:Short-chain dehydrogenase n=1 Tax=Planctomicrobium piriforme TaxID=1576369 RepID=A0A1I3DB45_9PLAN|nr:SDR family oxidoreductase [Planctomicrobium piriforme]SFH83711.1 Short-chain dehydrogenase [Planctomicrobium piriforme]